MSRTPRYLSSIPAHEPTTKNCWLSTVLRNGEVSSPRSTPPRPAARALGDGAALTGLPVGTPVHAGPFDLCASMIGAGVQRPGDGLVILGTTLGCAVLVDRVETDGPLAGMLLCMPERDRWASDAGNGWHTVARVGTHADRRAVRTSMRSWPHRSRSRGLVVLPPSLRLESEHRLSIPPPGVNLVSLESKPADVVRAVCEGIAYAVRHCLESAACASGAAGVAQRRRCPLRGMATDPGGRLAAAPRWRGNRKSAPVERPWQR